MFKMHRIFCATPWELEAERGHFHDIVGQFNETMSMRERVLYVPVTLVNIRDKRPVQYAVDENIRDCRHYILLLSEDWGPVERNFESDYRLALQCTADPALPMRDVAVLRRFSPSRRALAAGLPEPVATFGTPAEFDQCMHNLLSNWFAALREERLNSLEPHERHATA